MKVECEECAERMVKNTPAGYGEEELRSGEECAYGAWYGGGDAPGEVGSWILNVGSIEFRGCAGVKNARCAW